MKQAAAALGVVGLTAAALAGLAALRPFTHVSDGLDRVFDATPRWTQVTNVLRDPAVMDTTGGGRPVESFGKLAEIWARDPGAPRVMLMGNSQMQAVSLAPGEPPPTGVESTYADQVALRLRAGSPRVLGYRLSAGGLNYTEALWYVNVLAANPRVKPDVIVMQLNYQAFWLSGIRAGMEDLAVDPGARAVLERQAAEDPRYGSMFGGAIASASKRQAAARAGETPVAQPGYGRGLEERARDLMTAWPVYRGRRATKDEFLDLLYRLRIYVLRLQPSTARSITGTRLERSRAALEALAKVCAQNGIRLVLFNAPLNPKVQLYRTEADRRGYLEFIHDFARRHRLVLHDFEDAVPAELWGRWFNGPDPLHLGRQAHLQMAERVERVAREALERR